MSTTTQSPGASAPRFFALFALVSALGFVLLPACGGPAQPAHPATGEAVAPPPAVVDASDAGHAAPSTGLCGCKLCAPKISDDPCKTDADCAAATPCHATSCVAVSRLTAPAAPAICTRIMMCGTTDANACTCYQGKCALTPRP